MAAHLRTELVVEALEMAVAQRRPAAVIHHSDRGCQYTSLAFGARCREWDVALSMGSVGDCFDNAMAESFFATLECELLDRTGNGNQKRDPYGHVKRDPRGWRVNTSILLRRSEAGHGSPTAGNPPSPPPPIRTASRRFRPDAGAPWPPVRRRGRPGRPRPGRAARPIAAA